MRKWIGLCLALLACTGCVERPEPAEATLTTDPPPWAAPRDGISWIEAAGMPLLDFGDETDPWIIDMSIEVDGEEVEIPAFIGMDRLRAVQAPVHTHETDGLVWLEGEGNREVTLGQFFHVWGVAFDDECLASYCHELTVVADGEEVDEPTSLVLRGIEDLSVSVHSS